MTDTQHKPAAVQRLEDDLSLLVKLVPLLGAAMERVGRQQPGYPSAKRFDGGRSGGGGGSAVERLLDDNGNIIDPTKRERDALYTLLSSIHRDADALDRWIHANAPKPADERAKKLAELDQPERVLCQHCAKWRARGNELDVHATGDVAGNLSDPISLCRWCYDFVRRTGRLAYRSEVERHDKGLRVMVQA